jgi:hypothetical protein
MIRTLADQKYIPALASWPGGIKILISNGLTETVDGVLATLCRTAIEMKKTESVVALLPLKPLLTEHDWSSANRCLDDLSNPVDAAQSGQVFDALACLLSSQDDVLQDEHDCTYEIRLHETHLYNCSTLTVRGAGCAWKFGHHNLNCVRCCYGHNECNNSRDYRTPLWSSARSIWRHNSISRLSLFRWLLTHGANGFWIHPVLLTTPIHSVARELAGYAVMERSISLVDSISDLLLLEQNDRCVCYCSRDGCHVIGCGVSMHFQRYTWVTSNEWRGGRSYLHRMILPYLFALVQHNRDAAWMSSAVLRVLTFEELSLTHTCCYWIRHEFNGYFERPTPEEAQVIHELEREDIELLNNLVAKFEAKWATYTRPFVTFMNRVWKPRMREVRAERQVDTDTYQAELQRMGVTLKEADAKDDLDFDSESDWPDEYESEGDGWYTTDEEDENMDTTGEGDDEDEDEDEEERREEDLIAVTD